MPDNQPNRSEDPAGINLSMNTANDKEHEETEKTDHCIENSQIKPQTESFIKKIQLKEYQLTINAKKLPNPAELLEEFMAIRENENLQNEVKMEIIRKKMKEYVE